MKRFVTLLVVVLFAAPMAAFAQNGCVNSPESPTVLLAVIGSAAGVLRYRWTHHK